MPKIITLTTDFGLRDPYAGMMKGAVLAVHESACIIDITHQIEPQAIDQASRIIHSAYACFPAGTVHVVVVDPGVGGHRRAVALESDGHIFLAPDNGVLTGILETGGTHNCVSIEEARYFRPRVSRTFHGRDIFAPVAGHVANGVPLRELGPPLSVQQLVRLDSPRAVIRNETEVAGRVTTVDRFGNLITDIKSDLLEEFLQRRSLDKSSLSIRIGACTVAGVRDCYQDVPAGQLLAIIGSSGYLEIALNRGNARGYCQAGPGDAVLVSVR
ncbi:MAG: SAM hydrolase/SAM-dependent halogenase family protein [Thermodesulfobacteriota bacterium]